MNCPIHLGAITLEIEKAAALPCGHVFCLSCITKCLDAKRTKSCPCPICKKPTTRKQIITLFLESRSPSSSPAKSQVMGHMSAAGKSHARALRQNLQNLNANVTVEEVTNACSEMEQFADGMAGVPDIEAKCLGEEIKAAAMRFQNLILPELQELTSARARVKDLTEENALLKSTLHRKDKEIDFKNRKRISAERDLVNVQMAKRIVDDKASGLREALSVATEKLKDAQNTIQEKDELIKKKEADLIKHRRWTADHKLATETCKAKNRELERRIFELEQMMHSVTPIEYSQREFHDGSPTEGFDDHHEYEDNIEPSSKRRRTEQDMPLADMKLDKSCFVMKPPTSFRILPKKQPEVRAAGPSVTAVNVTRGGQIKGTVALGSRQRIGKMGYTKKYLKSTVA